MQTVQKMIVVMAAAVVLTSGTAMASGHRAGHDVECQKDCQMLVRNCDQEVDTLPQRIERLKHEIGKGDAAYTPDELKTLQGKLKDAEDQLTNLTFGS